MVVSMRERKREKEKERVQIESYELVTSESIKYRNLSIGVLQKETSE